MPPINKIFNLVRASMTLIFIFLLPSFADQKLTDAKNMYNSCRFCHGEKAEKTYMGILPIKNLSQKELVSILQQYKAGNRNVVGMGNAMQTQIKNFETDDIVVLAKYIKTLNKGKE